MAAWIEPGRVQAAHQSLHHMVAKAEWSDQTVLALVRAQVLPTITQDSAITARIISADLDLPWLAAIQNTAAASPTMLSPIRLALGCALAARPDLERPLYRHAWPLGAMPLVLLTAAALLAVRHALP